jgi:hypothetical protein
VSVVAESESSERLSKLVKDMLETEEQSASEGRPTESECRHAETDKSTNEIGEAP